MFILLCQNIQKFWADFVYACRFGTDLNSQMSVVVFGKMINLVTIISGHRCEYDQ